jgi:putative addiction module component (TIGR02574 family)
VRAFLGDFWYQAAMTKFLEQTLREVEQLSAPEQDAAAGALLDYLAHRNDTQLTDEQLAEVRRRRADPDRTLISHDEARARIRKLGA